MDIYKAMLLSDEVLDDSSEYHGEALIASKQDFESEHFDRRASELCKTMIFDERGREALAELAVATNLSDYQIMTVCRDVWSRMCPVRLAQHLATLGCLRSALQIVKNATKVHGSYQLVRDEEQRILLLAQSRMGLEEPPHASDEIPERGLVRREVYPWNHHEVDRLSKQSTAQLNARLSEVSTKLEVRLTELPALHSEQTPSVEQPTETKTSMQLGLFATANIEPGEVILRERSLLAANARVHERLCDACSTQLPDLSADEANQTYGCPDCEDVVFCSEGCRDLAQIAYHRSTCGTNIEEIGKDVPAAQAADALYTQLLFRSIAMAYTQDIHPLDLDEVKFLWGDFEPTPSMRLHEAGGSNQDKFASVARTLPFDFQSQVIQPLHLLEQLDINIFEAPHALAETWVYNTLLAKFRGTASGRISPRDGRPESAAVHPLWCLGNHSCDPNVEWQWAGEITFTARRKRIGWCKNQTDDATPIQKPGEDGGIARGQEILSHYVDIDLPVKARREWAVGALGGLCMCDRCAWESDQDKESLHG